MKYDRTIDYGTYSSIYVLDEKGYPSEDKRRAYLIDNRHGKETMRRRHRKIMHQYKGIKLKGHGLELAFGWGTSTKWLLENYEDITLDGLDFSEYMEKNIPILRDIFGDRIRDFWRGDVQEIEKPDNHYDFINSCSVFEHLPDCVYWNTLKECYRVLKPGGLMGVWLDRGEQDGQHLRMDKPKVTRRDMESVGFKAIHNYLYTKVDNER